MANDKKIKKFKPENLLLDVDGVFNTGHFLYTEKGKFAKIFGPHDNDGIKMIRNKMKVQALSADKRGFAITKKRMDDMKISLELVGEGDRLEWIEKNFDLEKSIYMGDGFHDIKIFKKVAYSIAPKNAYHLTRKQADYVTESNSGEGAVLDACLHILKKFYEIDFT